MVFENGQVLWFHDIKTTSVRLRKLVRLGAVEPFDVKMLALSNCLKSEDHEDLNGKIQNWWTAATKPGMLSH